LVLFWRETPIQEVAQHETNLNEVSEGFDIAIDLVDMDTKCDTS
jgi:hypothetical protein